MTLPDSTPDRVDPAEASQAREVDALACALHTVERRLTPAQRAAQFGLHTDPATLHALLNSTTNRTGRRAS